MYKFVKGTFDVLNVAGIQARVIAYHLVVYKKKLRVFDLVMR